MYLPSQTDTVEGFRPLVRVALRDDELDVGGGRVIGAYRGPGHAREGSRKSHGTEPAPEFRQGEKTRLTYHCNLHYSTRLL